MAIAFLNLEQVDDFDGVDLFSSDVLRPVDLPESPESNRVLAQNELIYRVELGRQSPGQLYLI